MMENSNMYMPVAPAGNGAGFGGDFGAWIILFLIFGMFGGGFGGGGFGGGYDFPWLLNGQNAINANTNAGFQNAALQGAIGDLNVGVVGGFAGVNASVNNAQNAITQQLYTNQISDLERSYAAQTANTAGLTNVSNQLANCCCENRLATAQTQALVQAENCADRAALADGIRDIIASQTAGTQRILDTLCQDKIDAKNEKIVELQNKLNIAEFNSSQAEQNNYLQNALTAQTQYFLSLYPRPTTTTTTTP